jgi:hypothetical protein
MADAFTHMYDTCIHDHATTAMEPMKALEMQVYSVEMQRVFHKYESVLESLFLEFSSPRGRYTDPRSQ